MVVHSTLVRTAPEKKTFRHPSKTGQMWQRFGVKCKGNLKQVKIFSSNLTTFTPHLTGNKVYLIFMIWKSSVFQIDIRVSYSIAPSSQQNMHFEEWRFPKSYINLKSESNSEIFIVQIQNIMKCFQETKNNSVLTFMLTIKAATSVNVVYLQYQTIHLLLQCSAFLFGANFLFVPSW